MSYPRPIAYSLYLPQFVPYGAMATHKTRRANLSQHRIRTYTAHAMILFNVYGIPLFRYMAGILLHQPPPLELSRRHIDHLRRPAGMSGSRGWSYSMAIHSMAEVLAVADVVRPAVCLRCVVRLVGHRK